MLGRHDEVSPCGCANTGEPGPEPATASVAVAPSVENLSKCTLSAARGTRTYAHAESVSTRRCPRSSDQHSLPNYRSLNFVGSLGLHPEMLQNPPWKAWLLFFLLSLFDL